MAKFIEDLILELIILQRACTIIGRDLLPH